MKVIDSIRAYYDRAPYTSVWQERWYVKVFAVAVAVAVIVLVARYT